jgi:acetylglutamate kinase
MTLSSAEPFAALLDELAAYRRQTIVIKVGGNSIDEDPSFLPLLVRQIAFLRDNGVRPVIVHGGGPQIDRRLSLEGLSAAKGPDGRRITTPAMMPFVLDAMQNISRAVTDAFALLACPVWAAALNDRCLIEAEPLVADGKGPATDRTGRPKTVDTAVLTAQLEAKAVVVLTSLGRDAQGFDYNINADDSAMAVANALQAKRLIMATNVAGVLDGDKKLISRLTPTDAQRLIAEGVIRGGMIPKVESATRALAEGVNGVAIINAHEPGALLAELLSPAGQGTLLTTAPLS